MRSIEEIKADIMLAAVTDGIPLSRLKELCQAEREGRCVVLPCKVGSTVYKIATLVSGETLIVEGKIAERLTDLAGVEFYFSEETRQHSVWCGAGCFGKTLFLTRAEAEAALKEQQP